MKKKSFEVLDNSKNLSQSLTINTFLLAQMLYAILYLVPNMTLELSLKRCHNGGFVCGIPVGD